MKRALFVMAVTIFIGGLVFTFPTSAQFVPPTKKIPHPQITKGPEIESSTNDFTIITWTSVNPGGSPEHYAVIHFGTDRNLSQMAKSHIRLNQGHRYTVFRVRMLNLQPKTTYYYKVDSMDESGASDGVDSPVKQFTTP